jgi:hypothetical protein
MGTKSASTIDATQRILFIRGQKVIIDADLAQLYGVTTKRLNEQVKRNSERFPADFMFKLSADEAAIGNRSQFATGSQRHRDPRFTPFAFTEHGALMAASVLNTPRAVEMSLYVVRAFVRLREVLATHKELAKKLDELEKTVATLDARTDARFRETFNAIRALMTPPALNKRPIGFVTAAEKKRE